ncbi:IspD/TarI family cytidylyltransferase [Erysipelothrix rhusiopathiae]|uniref:IspD/TarI family cytidylyltransferase n=1 Tax=Erysipelothrix rhusiopathiae TaxID=1648 RepID=UPI002B24FB56|nr:IspD/TarI family cytidylyltransferase [Erysipelothrix rhusiopathiae]WRB93489.1 IspD/TarI family cytidylyltransferase [Erysipelothrix rhusiopathiae]
MNIALIFAGGVGNRFKLGQGPKQFMKVKGKEILVHTLEKFQECEAIDSIILVSNPDYIDTCAALIKQYNLSKVVETVPGGITGQASIFNGLRYAANNFPKESIILIHDGVRPLISNILIQNNIEMVTRKGNAITVAPAIETVIAIKGEHIEAVYDRVNCFHAKAPQSFILGDIYQCHLKAIEEGLENIIDSANLMSYYGHTLHVVEGSVDNIKVTTDKDFYILNALLQGEGDEDEI